jgi:hypothetical protein
LTNPSKIVIPSVHTLLSLLLQLLEDFGSLVHGLSTIQNHGLDLIRFGGHLPKGGYDVRNGRHTKPTAPSAVLG